MRLIRLSGTKLSSAYEYQRHGFCRNCKAKCDFVSRGCSRSGVSAHQNFFVVDARCDGVVTKGYELVLPPYHSQKKEEEVIVVVCRLQEIPLQANKG